MSLRLSCIDKLAYIPRVQHFLRESEGISVLVPLNAAVGTALNYTFLSEMITLTFHSSLEAVELIADRHDRYGC